VGQDFPGRKEKRQGRSVDYRDCFTSPRLRRSEFGVQREPRRQILLRTFLGPKSLRYNDNRPLREKVPQQRSEKRLGRGADARARQHSPLLQAPCQGLDSGSFRDSSEQFACRCDCQILRQAGARWQARAEASRTANDGAASLAAAFASPGSPRSAVGIPAGVSSFVPCRGKTPTPIQSSPAACW